MPFKCQRCGNDVTVIRRFFATPYNGRTVDTMIEECDNCGVFVSSRDVPHDEDGYQEWLKRLEES